MQNKQIKLYFLFVSFCLIVFNSCDNTLEEADVKTADFTVNSEHSYLTQTIDFVALDSLGGTAYTWDFGDGCVIKGGHKMSHVYENGGQYVVELSINEFKNTKQIRVDPGTLSFKIINNSGRYLDLLTYIDNYETGSVKRFVVDSKHQSDTIYGKNLFWNNMHLFGISVFIENTEYILEDAPWIFDFKHTDFILTDSTRLIPRSSHGDAGVSLLKDL